ncbi:MAG: hypothetical protein HOD92_02870 [Deltaproteobacteria bacterium]|jgi:hypothetical protein|nr:hypothetical protein [Deltaproteobacteria bacterium]
MKKAFYIHFLYLLVITLFIMSCAADEVEVEIYSSDIQTAMEGEVIEVPLKAVFKLMGEDKDGNLPKAQEIAKKYLSKDSEMTITKGAYSSVLTISTTIPLGIKKSMVEYLSKNVRIAMLLITKNKIVFVPNNKLDTLNAELQKINFMLDVDIPAKKTLFRIVNDQKKELKVSATAIFVNNKPYLNFKKALKRRKSEVLEFRGGEESVYSEIPAHFNLEQ